MTTTTANAARRVAAALRTSLVLLDTGANDDRQQEADVLVDTLAVDLAVTGATETPALTAYLAGEFDSDGYDAALAALAEVEALSL